ncbi:MAG: pyrimidine/purine nucleoside phosphorylase [Cytophagales bacterium]|nr:pyrimidine/purine nucleoside phosphorylase [Cytophagales bacterium]
MIQINEYFGGQVRSLGYQTADGKATVGVMLPGTYQFNTGQMEIVTIMEGRMLVKLAGEDQFYPFELTESFEVPAHSSFEVQIESPTSYLCQFR